MLVLISSIFHTFSVNSQNKFLSSDFVCNKCLVLIQTCYRTIVDLRCINIFDSSLKSLSKALTWINNILFLLNMKCATKH